MSGWPRLICADRPGPLTRGRDIFCCFDSSAKISPRPRPVHPVASRTLLSAPHFILARLTWHLAPGNVANINYHVECVNVCNTRILSSELTPSPLTGHGKFFTSSYLFVCFAFFDLILLAINSLMMWGNRLN